MSIEAYNYIPQPTVPQPDLPIIVPHREDIWIGLTPRDACHFRLVVAVRPSAKELATLDVPDKNVFVRSDDSTARTGGFRGSERGRGGEFFVRDPDGVGRWGGDKSEGFGGFEFSIPRVLISSYGLRLETEWTGRSHR